MKEGGNGSNAADPGPVVNSDASLSLPPRPKMEPSIEAYTTEQLEQRLSFIETSLKRRDITPRSVIFMNTYKEQVIDAINASTSEDREAYVTGLQLLDHVLETECFLQQPSPGGDVTQLQQEILQLRELQYFARYGDYLQHIPNQVRKYVHDKNISGNHHLPFAEKWTNIADILLTTPVTSKEMQRKNQLRGVIAAASMDLGLDPALVRFSIVEYGKRNEAVHHGLQQLKETGNYPGLAQALCEDWKDVDLILSEVRQDFDHEKLKRIIESEINRCFHTNDGGYANWWAWTSTEYLQSLAVKKTQPGKASAGAVLCSPSQDSFHFEGMKRVASSETPLASEVKTNKRLEALARKARLGERVAGIQKEVADKIAEQAELE